ncbi:flagellar hook protein FlgE [Pseudomonas sp. TWP3-1]|uniref:flagellar hook protein FlgE n=1 Tax=unclassified Pseudomonas TaxID=196821 RepID=UPI003CE98C41
MSFNIGLSGLYAANKQLDVTGNNIANVATAGFKSSRAEFEDVYSATRLGTGSKVIGNGVRLANVSQQFTQGDISNTGNVLDMGINGSGFFTMSNNGSISYTRAGTFKVDDQGFITNTDYTSHLQGYGVDSNGRVIKGVLTDLKIDTSNLAPKSTSAVGSSINLNSSAPVIVDTGATGVKFDPTKVESYTESFSTPIYDSQGNKHDMDQYVVKTGQNTWKVYTLVDGRNPDATGSDPKTTPPTASTLTFDSAGKLTQISTPDPANPATPIISSDLTLKNWKPGTVTGGVFTPNGAAANPAGVTISMAKTTQYNADTSRTIPTQDGYATGQITNLTIDGTGTLFANFSNNQNKAIGQVALASFTNEQGLQAVGGTSWKETFASGIPGYDAPETGTLGSIQSNSLEESNVNLTNELVDLIKGQSNYQANAKTISTQSTIMQTIIQMA